MKKLIKTLLILVVATYAISCCGSAENENEQTHEHVEDTHDHEKSETKHEEHAESDFTLELNQGSLWKANIETSEGIGNMVVLMNGFNDTESVAAYSALSEDLTATINTLLKECTMEGEPHNHLHSYLYPMFDLIEGIGSSDLATCKTNYNKLKAQLSEYPNYFE